MKLKKIFKMLTLWLLNTVRVTFPFSFILFILALFFGCASNKLTSSGANTEVSIKSNQWVINGQNVHKDSPAEGLLMNVRMVNAAFEDMNSAVKETIQDFNPDENTTRFINKIPKYVNQGIRGFTISLQGGFPGYEGAVNSAFNADGSLRNAYMDRILRIVQAADHHGVVIILTCFYQRQHSHERALEGKQAILNAVGNVASWVKDRKFTNVVLEISNEYAHGGYRNWKDGEWLRSVPGQVELINYAKTTAPGLLVSTSGMGNGLIAEPIARAADFIMIHFNNTAIADIPERIKQASIYGKPVLCNEDDKTGQAGAEAARLSVRSGAGWGFMHMEKNQSVPFEFDGAADDPIVYRMVSRLTTPGGSVEKVASEELSVLITEPKDGDVFIAGEPFNLKAVATGIKDFNDAEVHFYIGKQLIGKSLSAPWKIISRNIPAGKHYVVAVVKDSNGHEIMRSRLVDFEVKSPNTGSMIFPGTEWKESIPELQGVDAKKLQEAVTYLENNSGSDGVKELMIIRNGYVIWKGTEINKKHNVWSLTKSFTSTVLGLLIDEGKATLSTRAASYLPELANTYSDITLRHLATMTSGYCAVGDDPEVSHGQSITPFIPSPTPLFAPAGSKFAYWDSSMNQFGNIVTQIAEESMESLFKRKIADPIGMNPDQWHWGDWGQVKGVVVNGGAGNKGKGIYISANELARLGHLFLNLGNWNHRQLIKAEWIKEATTTQVPASTPVGHSASNKKTGFYGYNWWTNGINAENKHLWPDAPSSTFSASGFNNNDMFIIPEWDMVIVRLGLDQNEFLITDEIYNSFMKKVGHSILASEARNN